MNRSFSTLPTNDALPIFQTTSTQETIRSRLSSIPHNFGRSKSVATLRESYSGRSVRKILNWGWGFLSSGESHKIEKAVLGGQSGTSWRNLVQKVRIRVKKILTSNHNVGRPQTCRYNSFDYSKNFDDGCSKSCRLAQPSVANLLNYLYSRKRVSAALADKDSSFIAPRVTAYVRSLKNGD
ncbi:hypothetical protein QQ045_012770 [Rhodiola kirilowii]